MSERPSYCPFVVGQHVVCVDAKNTTIQGDVEITEGDVYTVRWVGPIRVDGPDLERAYRHETIGVRLVETTRPDPWFPDWPFAASRFRPAHPSPPSQSF